MNAWLLWLAVVMAFSCARHATTSGMVANTIIDISDRIVALLRPHDILSRQILSVLPLSVFDTRLQSPTRPTGTPSNVYRKLNLVLGRNGLIHSRHFTHSSPKFTGIKVAKCCLDFRHHSYLTSFRFEIGAKQINGNLKHSSGAAVVVFFSTQTLHPTLF